MGTWNPVRHTPVNFTAATAILVCALLTSLTDIDWAPNVVIGILILEIGVVGVWMLDRRRTVSEPPPTA